MKSNKAKTEQFAFYSMEIGAERYRERVESCCVKTYASFANKRKGKNSRENYISPEGTTPTIPMASWWCG